MSKVPPISKSIGNILITGGCGFLGHHLVKLCVEKHPESRIFVLDLRTSANRVSSPQVSYHEGDITDFAATKAIFEKTKPNVVFHTASPNFNGKKEVLMKVNVEGTKSIIKACQETGVKALVYTSSAMVAFNYNTGARNIDERWPLVTGTDQIEYYATTKASLLGLRWYSLQTINSMQAYAESEVLEANRKPSTLLTCSLRPAGIFGEGDVQQLPKIIGAYRKGQHRFQIGDNTNLYDFTYVGNIAWAHILAATALLATHALGATVPLDTERVDGEAFFITNDEPIYFWDYARAVWAICGSELHPSKVWCISPDFMQIIGFLAEWIMWGLGKTPNVTRQQVIYSCFTRYFCINKAKKRLGYQPLVSMDEALRRSVKDILEREQKAGEKKDQ